MASELLSVVGVIFTVVSLVFLIYYAVGIRISSYGIRQVHIYENTNTPGYKTEKELQKINRATSFIQTTGLCPQEVEINSRLMIDDLKPKLKASIVCLIIGIVMIFVGISSAKKEASPEAFSFTLYIWHSDLLF